MNSRRSFICAAMGISAGALLTACGGSETNSSSGIPKTVPESQIPQSTQVTPQLRTQEINGITYSMGENFLTIGPENAENTVRIYSDLACPHCRMLNGHIRSIVEKKVSNKENVKFELITVNILSNPFKYAWSAVAGSTLAAIADKHPDSYLKAESVLLDNQPSQRSKDAVNPDYLIDLLKNKDVPINDDDMKLIKEVSYLDWVNKVTEFATNDGLDGTPLVVINDERLQNYGEAAERLRSLNN